MESWSRKEEKKKKRRKEEKKKRRVTNRVLRFGVRIGG